MNNVLLLQQRSWYYRQMYLCENGEESDYHTRSTPGVEPIICAMVTSYGCQNMNNIRVGLLLEESSRLVKYIDLHLANMSSLDMVTLLTFNGSI